MSAKNKLNEIIKRAESSERWFEAGYAGIKVLKGREAQQWLADIKAVLINLDKNELTNSIVGLTKGFPGWRDETNFERLVSELNVLYNSFDGFENKAKYKNSFGQVEEAAVLDVIRICLRLQTDKHIMQGDENDINRSIRAHLESIGYNVSDQSQRGKSASGKESGEIDILIKDKDNIPSFYIEGLKVNCLDSAKITKHLNKIYNYDSNGVKTNIMLIYSYAIDFKDLWDRYLDFIKTNKLEYELSRTEDVSIDKYADLRTAKSIFLREGFERNLIHIFLNCRI